MAIIQISFDYPDKLYGNKTKAVKNLVYSQNVSENIVFSLNRTAVRINKLKAQKEPHGYTLYTFGLPFGILLFLWMFIIYRRIAKIIEKEGIKPELIHAHKLTYEGIIAYFLSKKFKAPYILTFRGYSDIEVLQYKPLYHRFYAHIIQHAKKIIFLAPWAVKSAKKYLGRDVLSDKYVVLPNIISLGDRSKAENIRNNRFITVLNFKLYKLKNIKRVIKACERVFSKYPNYGLDIVGGGPNKNKIISFIQKNNYPDHFCLKGEIENSVLLKKYSEYMGFVLPSYPETFGLVFLEALAAGTPLIYSKNAGIDGYFEDFDIGIGVNHRSVEEIALAIETIILKNDEYIKNVEQLISKGFLNQFSKSEVGEKYSGIISQYALSVKDESGKKTLTYKSN